MSRSRWAQDQRLQEARRLLQSSRPVTVPVTQRPEVSDHEFVEEQEHYLKRLCERTMSLAVGRGVAGLRTVSSLPTETLDIPPLCLTGRAPPRGAKAGLNILTKILMKNRCFMKNEVITKIEKRGNLCFPNFSFFRLSIYTIILFSPSNIHPELRWS